MSIRLAVVQPVTNRPPDDFLNVRDAIDYVEKAAGNGAHIVAFPESYPGPWRMPASFDAIEPMVKIATDCNVYVQFGTLEPINSATGEAHQLSVLAYPDGRSPAIYRRTCPPGPWIYTGGVWEFQYVAADELPVFATEHGTIGMGICSEVYMPEVCRALALQGAEIIFLPAGIAKPELWETWRTLVWARAIENLAVVVTTQNLFSTKELGLAMVATPERILLQSVASGICYAEFDLDEVRRLRSEEDGLASKNRAKAGVLTQWQRPELWRKVFPNR